VRQIIAWMSGLLAAFALSGCATQGPAGDWITLLDGERGLENWNRTGEGNWRAAQGAIQIDGKTNKDAAFLYSKSTYADFELYIEYSADENANSGVFLRITNTQTINTKGGYEVQIFDKNANFPTASMVNLAKAPERFSNAAGRWNAFSIKARGSRITVDMNGERAVEVDNNAFPRGPIGLQYNSGTLRFRKVLIRPL
jgi:uncharacterized protein (DUF2141 family)